MDHTRLDLLPLWGLFAATIAVVILSIEGGYRLGKYRRRRSDQEKEAPVGARACREWESEYRPRPGDCRAFLGLQSTPAGTSGE